jgi:hypothetical protein
LLAAAAAKHGGKATVEIVEENGPPGRSVSVERPAEPAEQSAPDIP